MARFTALDRLLMDAGYSQTRAQHMRRVLDRLRLCGHGSDDIAAALFSWRDKALRDREVQVRSWERRTVGLPDATVAEMLPF